jgi:hypothetical protein
VLGGWAEVAKTTKSGGDCPGRTPQAGAVSLCVDSRSSSSPRTQSLRSRSGRHG